MLLVLLSGCVTAPDWVRRGSRSDGAVHYGVASAPPSSNRSLQRTRAENRARREIAALSGELDEVALKNGKTTRVWIDPEGHLYVMVEIGTATSAQR